MSEADQYALGIDLGTTYSSVAIWRNGMIEVIANDMGERTTPSYISFVDENERLIGSAGKGFSSRNAKNTIFNFKRIIGRKYDDPIVQKEIESLPVKMIKSSQNTPLYQLTCIDQTFSPEEIASMILGYIQNLAQWYLGFHIKKCVLSVPSNFNYSQRQSILTAAKIAGLNVMQLINSSTAVAIKYAHDAHNTFVGNVVIIDFGGGSCDVSVMAINKNMINVIATTGNTYLGSEDIDSILVNYFAQKFKQQYKLDLTTSDRAIRRLKTQCERAKRTLSHTYTANIEIDSLYHGTDVCWRITRSRYMDLCDQYFPSCIEYVKSALNDAEMLRSDIDDVIVVGGSCRATICQQMIKEYFSGTKINDINRRISPDEAIICGAAIHAAILNGSRQFNAYDIRDITVTSVYMVDNRHDTLTTEQIIAEGMSIPCTVIKKLKTMEDNQSSFAPFKVYTGITDEEEMKNDMKLFGIFEVIGGIPAGPKGSVVNIVFNIDESGVLSINANCNEIFMMIVMNGYIRRIQSLSYIPESIKCIIVEFSGFDEILSKIGTRIEMKCNADRMSEEQIKEKISERFVWNTMEEIRRERIKYKNELEDMAFRMRNTLYDPQLKDWFNETDKQTVLNAVQETINWVDTNRDAKKEEYQAKKKKLEEIWQPILIAYLEQSTVSGGMSGMPTFDEVD